MRTIGRSLFNLLILTTASLALIAQNPARQPVELSIESGAIVGNRLGGSDAAHVYRIRAATGRFVRIEVSQTEVDVVATVFSPTEAKIMRFDDEPRRGFSETVEFVTETDGEYRIEVEPRARFGAGTYDIRIALYQYATEHNRSAFSARQLIGAGAELIDQNRFDDALAKFREAQSISARLTDANILKLRIVERLGNLFFEKGDYKSSRTEFDKGLEDSRNLLGEDHPQTLRFRFGITLTARRAGETARAERGFRELIPVFERVIGPQSYEVATTLNSLANIREQLNDFDEAERMFGRALGIVERNFGPEIPLTASILNNLGVLYLHSNRNDRAAENFERSAAIRERTGATADPEYSNTLQNLGIVYRNRREYAKALAVYERALVLREKALGPEHPNIGFLLNNIANIQKVRGDFGAALATQRRVREIAEKSVGEFHELTLASIGNTANVYGAMGDMPKSFEFQRLWDIRFERTLALNLSIGSERQKLAYVSRIEERTSRTLTLAKFAGQPAVDAAAEVVLQRKGRVLDSVAGNLEAIRKRATVRDAELLGKLSDVVGRLAKLVLSKPPAMPREEYEKQIAALESQKETLERAISNEAAPLFVAPPVSLEKVRTAIPDDAALIEFAIYRPYDYTAENNDVAYAKARYVAFVIRKSATVKMIDLGERDAIDTAIGSLRAALRDPASMDIAARSKRVRKLVVEPLAALFRGSKKLLIAPDGDLNLIPFEALADPRGRYLIDDFSIIYLNSGRDLLRPPAQAASLNGPLVVADPAFGAIDGDAVDTANREISGESFVPLPGTAAEAETIRQMLPQTKVLTGAEATEDRLKAVVRPSLLHIASHGFFFRGNSDKAADENPLIRAGLALAGANLRNPTGGDGIMTALEASALDLRGTRLVVLSACDTGLGEIRAGEGVYGLRRAFALAGAESIIMTLWPVGDYTSRRIVSSYYKNLSAGFGRNEALRLTVLQIKGKPESSHPYYWAPFVHWGNWNRLDIVR